MDILLALLTIIVFSVVLVKAADFTISALVTLSRKTKTGTFLLSAIIIAIGTSLPEMFVGITSALDGSPNLSLGNVMGANITNLSLVAGIAAFVFSSVRFQGEMFRRDMAVAMLAGAIPFLFVVDGSISRVDGLVLLAIYGVYASSLFRKRYGEIAEARIKSRHQNQIQLIFREINILGKNGYKEMAKLFLGLAVLLFSADAIVGAAKSIATSLHVPVFLIGLIVISIGTTLPELVFSIRSLRDHHPSMFIGNLLGSIIANSTLVIGIASVISPIHVISIGNYLTAFVFFIIIFSIFWILTGTKLRLDRWEAGVLLILYVIFAMAEFLVK